MKTPSLRTKLLFSYGVFITVFVLISVGYWFIQFKIEQNNTAKERLSIFSNNTLASFDEIIEDINPLLYLHVNDPRVEEILIDSGKTIEERSQELDAVANLLVQNNSYINSVCFIVNDGMISVGQSNVDYNISEIKEILFNRDGIPFIDNPIMEFPSQYSRRVIPVYKEMFGSNGKSIGIIILNLDAAAVFSRIDNRGKEDLHMIIVDSDHRVIYKSNHHSLYSIPSSEIEESDLLETEYKGKTFFMHNGKTYSLWGVQEPLTAWTFLIHYNETVLTRNVGKNVLIFIGISLSALLVMSVAAWYISSSFTKNLGLFTNALQNSKDTPIPQKISETEIVGDEIGTLITEYNKMIDRLTISQRNEYISKIHSQNMQIKMLSYQINPHFLYNCLNLISSLAIIDNVPRISSISKTMGEMYRYTLHHDDMVQIRDELEQLFNYIDIQKIRFHNNFEIKYDIAPDLLDIPCMKFILQPIVENTFIHGFSSSLKNYNPNSQVEKPRIEVVIYNDDNNIHIICTDNGCGISSERLTQIRNELSTTVEGMHESLGLWNIHQRISTYYGASYGITINSIENKYTTIELSYPLTVSDNHSR